MGYAGAERNKKHLSFKKLPLEQGKKMHKYRVMNLTFLEGLRIFDIFGGILEG